MEYRAGHKAIPEFVAEPFEVSCRLAGWRGGGFDLDGEDFAGGDLGDQVDLVTALLVTQVVQPWRVGREFELRPELSDSE